MDVKHFVDAAEVIVNCVLTQMTQLRNFVWSFARDGEIEHGL